MLLKNVCIVYIPSGTFLRLLMRTFCVQSTQKLVNHVRKGAAKVDMRGRAFLRGVTRRALRRSGGVLHCMLQAHIFLSTNLFFSLFRRASAIFWTSLSESISFWSIGEIFATRWFFCCFAMWLKSPMNSAKKLKQISIKTFTIVNFALGSNFLRKINYGAGTRGGPKNLFLAQRVLETSSFHCLLQHNFIILKCPIFWNRNPWGALCGPLSSF